MIPLTESSLAHSSFNRRVVRDPLYRLPTRCRRQTLLCTFTLLRKCCRGGVYTVSINVMFSSSASRKHRRQSIRRRCCPAATCLAYDPEVLCASPSWARAVRRTAQACCGKKRLSRYLGVLVGAGCGEATTTGVCTPFSRQLESNQ